MGFFSSGSATTIAEGKVKISSEGTAQATAGIQGVVKQFALMAIQIGIVYKGMQELKASINNALDSMRIEGQLAQSVANAYDLQNIAANNLTMEYANLASQIQYKTGVSDEDIKQTMQRLAVFGAERDRMQETTMATMNLSNALGVDLNSASMMVGKALSGNIMLLQRYGIKIEEGADVVKLLNDRFNGMAEAAGTTLPGKLAILGTAQEDIREGFGRGILTTKAFQIALGALMDQAQRNGVTLTEVIATNTKNVIDNIWDFITAYHEGLANLLGNTLLIFESVIKDILILLAKAARGVMDIQNKLTGGGNAFGLPGLSSLFGGSRDVSDVDFMTDMIRQLEQRDAGSYGGPGGAILEALQGSRVEQDENIIEQGRTAYQTFLNGFRQQREQDALSEEIIRLLEEAANAGGGGGGARLAQVMVEEFNKELGSGKIALNPEKISLAFTKPVYEKMREVIGAGVMDGAMDENNVSAGTQLASQLWTGIAAVFDSEGKSVAQTFINMFKNMLMQALAGMFIKKAASFLTGIPFLGDLMGGFGSGGAASPVPLMSPTYTARRQMYAQRMYL